LSNEITVDDLQTQRLDNLEARLTALETIVIEVRANAKLLKVLAIGICALAGLNVQDMML
jgi:hypothetical protein